MASTSAGLFPRRERMAAAIVVTNQATGFLFFLLMRFKTAVMSDAVGIFSAKAAAG